MPDRVMCKRCSVKVAKCRGYLCTRCFNRVNGVTIAQSRREWAEGREVPATGQLLAIREAVRWPGPDEPEDPLVRMYVKLMQTNPREVAQQLERLEREHRLAMKAAAPSAPAAVPETKPDPSTSGADYETGDGYDPRADTASAQVIAMIDRWLAGHQARAMGKAEPPLVEDPDDLEIPG